jgi:5-oxoprolinase (ATP-hydrolysing) subunit C
MAFRVLSAGTHSLIVDLGRPDQRGRGVPVGGAADQTSFLLGNALVGNAPDAPALEIVLSGPTLEATDEHALVVQGASFDIHLGEQRLDVGRTFTAMPGSLLTIGAANAGMRAYLCVQGGFESKEILGSRSAFEPLRSGQELHCPAGKIGARWFEKEAPADGEIGVLRALKGKHVALVGADRFSAQDFTVSGDSNRMGLRLMGDALPRPTAELLSEPVCPGTVQLTNDGQCIVLGVDAQTIGGYPRIAHVITADLDKLGQLRANDRVRFEWVDLATASRLGRERRRRLKEWLARLGSPVLSW